MKYRLIKNSLNNIYNPKETVLKNRGINNINKYINLNDDDLHDYNLLDNIDLAVECLLKHIENQSNIHIIVDSDTDGYTSASILYNYLKLISPEINLSYSIHTGKQHGISDDIIIPENIQLLLIPDAATNDVEQCKLLKNKGVDIIILDHHIQDKENPYAIIINNQTCDYPNKQLSGVGIVYKFLQVLDEATWNYYADNFLDLVALGLIGDMMDIREYETKRLIDKGLSKIRNKMFKALIDKQSFSMGTDITINNVQFYIVPLINAMIRAGDYEEKELMFRAFIETDEVFKYKPRRKSKNDPEPEEIDETIYNRVARLCANAKNRQNNSKDKDVKKLFEYIKEKNIDNDKVMFINTTNILDNNMTGVVAMEVARKFNKPCLLLRRKEGTEDYYAGSGRNCSNSPLQNLKELLEETNLFDFVQGHDNAFGLGIKKENIRKAIEYINGKLKDVDFDYYYEVDFILDIEDLSIGFIKELDELKSIYGMGINEAYVLINNINVNKSDFIIMGKESNSWKFVFNNEIAFVKFKCNEEDKILNWLNDGWSDEETIEINVIGKAGVNNYNGILTPQIIIESYEIVSKE